MGKAVLLLPIIFWSLRQGTAAGRRQTIARHKRSEEPACVSGCQERQYESLVRLDQNYNFHLPPPSQAGVPVRVNFSINLRNVLEVNEVAETVSVETTLRMFWFDSRIELLNSSLAPATGRKGEEDDYVTLHPSITKQLWVPDIFVDQAVKLRAPTLHTKPTSLRLYRDGRIRYSTRVNYDVACAMDFHFYPHDVQTCHVRFESFSYNNKDLLFEWVEAGALGSSNINNISLAQFNVFSGLETYETKSYDVQYPGLILKLELRRKLMYHLIQTYLTSSVYLAISWLALFLPPKCIAERLAIAMTILLTLTSMFSSERRSVPRVSYVTCLDIWMVSCILFVFIELIEFSAIFFLTDNIKNRTWIITTIDRLTLVLLPATFATMNALYWPYLLNPYSTQFDFELI